MKCQGKKHGLSTLDPFISNREAPGPDQRGSTWGAGGGGTMAAKRYLHT